MRHFIILFACISLPLALISQNLGFELQSTYSKAVKEDQLLHAQNMHDINPGYPQNWIGEEDYISSEIKLIDDKKVIKAQGNNNILNADQQSLLKMAEIGNNIDVEVKYYSENVVTKERVINTMDSDSKVVDGLSIISLLTGDVLSSEIYLKKRLDVSIKELKARHPQN